MMDALLEELANLSDSDLCKELKSAGLTFGGISKSTRKFFEKRLATHKLKEQGLEDDGHQDKTESQNAEGQDDLPSPGESKKEDSATNGQTAEERQTGDPVTNSNSTGINRAVRDGVGSGNQSASYVKGETVYVVCIPVEGGIGQNDNSSICSVTKTISQSKKEAMKLMKANTEARFRTFRSLEEAQNFTRLQDNLTTPKKVNGASNSSEQPAVSDRANTYRTPKSQQLTGLRFVIEKRDAEKFRTLVWENPGYLVSSVDTPSVLHEGCKYNALHVAAMKNLPDMMELILDTINDPEIPKLLYPGDSEESRADRWGFVTHLYLNSLEKGNGETPLHFASKFGFTECVRILLDHPKCKKTMTNKYGETASEIICNRYKNNDKEKVNSAIAELLDDHFYIPVWRADDNSLPAVIGEPWSPDVPNGQSALLSEQAKGSPIDSNILLRALAGPMSPSEAVDFQKDWKTPPSFSKRQAAAIRRGDSEKGLERLGRELAHNKNVPWMEYWSFLDDFADFSTTEGLEILEDYLENRCHELTESSSQKKSSVTKVPAAVMKNLVSEFITTSTSNQVGVDKEAVTDISNRSDMDAMGAEKSKEGEIGVSDVGTRKCEPDNQFPHEQTEKSTDARSDRHMEKLPSELEEMSLSMKEKLDRDPGKGKVKNGHGEDDSSLGKNLRLNAGGDSCTVNAVPSSEGGLTSMPAPAFDTTKNEPSMKAQATTLDDLGRVGNEGEFKETLDLTAHPVVSSTCKPTKNSTESEASSKSAEPASPVGAASGSPGPESSRGLTARTPERTSMIGQVAKLLYSPVQMMHNMMAKLNIVSPRRQIAKEENDVDTGEALVSSKMEDERTEGITASSVTTCNSQSDQKSPLNRQQNQTASTEPNAFGDANENTRDTDTTDPGASGEHSSAPSTATSLSGDGTSPSRVTNIIDSNLDHDPHSHEENASPERTGDVTAAGVIGFQTPENQRLISTPPQAASVGLEFGAFFING
ncbi:ankyrin repeat and LEM domain-containing protein 2 [Strongylocentrotus purpuratus]|uniref:LEM domain-containing protein n=1 Tax=Strongylocentrotus purpuratus TaxID=7668 RepID=A0A7M7NIL2_STRPU|nr:ankyrin repeat and LEM domain-containing protein 2 [Strongylocentrotus purpuratus]|eukprot:XP_011679779.1 PREDICTED: ankyrin repeat and LEM domain-containing protein 2 [Strongylocentrotus purpuratus]